MLFSFLNPISASILAFLTSTLIVLLAGKRFIAYMHAWQHEGQPIRECGPQNHLKTKKGTPTMGGLLILLAIIISTLLYAELSSGFTWICIAVIIVFGATGFWDDYVKVKKHTPDAMTAKIKLLIGRTKKYKIALCTRGSAGWKFLDIKFLKDLILKINELYDASFFIT